MSPRCVIFLVIAFAACVAPAVAQTPPSTAASVQEGGMCWLPDVEFPVPCDEDDD